jgi:hypothetical protein
MVDDAQIADGGISGGCFCRAVRYRSSVRPLDALICQCRDCQYDSGSGHSCHVMLPRRSLVITGSIKLFDGVADSGNAVRRGFCPECGSSVLYETAAFPKAVFVTAGSLDDPGQFTPSMVVYTSSAQAWDRVDPSLPAFEGMPELGR